MIALHDLLVAGHPATTDVCRGDTAPVRFAAFRERVLALASTFAARFEHRYALCIDDTFDFTCALFALWVAKKEPILPPNATPACLADLAHAYDAVLTDTDLKACVFDMSTSSATSSHDAKIDAHAPLTLFTSGSSGLSKAIHKTLAQLNAEVHTLQRQFGASVAGVTHVGAVPHHHIYGLLFNILWPLAAGRAFARRNVATPRQIAACIARWGTVLVAATPAQLARWPDLPEFETLTGASCIFFSGGSPLDEATALRYVARFGVAPIEIYGSTETGGIGWRRRDGTQASQAWQPMPRIEVRAGGDDGDTLEIRSPHLADTNWHRTDDAVSFDAEGRFRLGGRLDRVRKIAGKRVSLTELERRLAQHEYVEEAAVVVLEHALPVHERPGALVALTQAGADALLAHGRVALTKVLHRHLAERFDLVVLPRRWRYCVSLPFDARGKLPTAAVAAAFVVRPEGFELLAETRRGHEAHYELRVPSTLVHFAGHFPTLPLLPGVVQIDWAMRLASAWAEDAQRFASIDRLKFMAPVPPGALLELALSHDAARHRVQFAYRLRGNDCASGIFVYRSGDGA